MFGLLSGLLGGAGGASGILSFASLAMTGVTTMMSLQAQKQQMKYSQMQAQLQQKQYKDQADATELQYKEAELDRKKKYFDRLSTNRALMAESGIDLGSASYRALLQSNYKTQKKDINNIKLMGLEDRLQSLYGVQQAKLSEQAAGVNYRSGVVNTLSNSASSVIDTGRELFPSRSMFNSKQSIRLPTRNPFKT
jgi:hypothetical protein|tara:strand:+ start:502 stop:1083 length:582 start_codon:yes stop_codon:yes gene_type:complete